LRNSINKWNTCCSSKQHSFHISQLHNYTTQLHHSIAWIALPCYLSKNQISCIKWSYENPSLKIPLSKSITKLKAFMYKDVFAYFNFEQWRIVCIMYATVWSKRGRKRDFKAKESFLKLNSFIIPSDFSDSAIFFKLNCWHPDLSNSYIEADYIKPKQFY
jgi:hypothetical protein